MPKQMVQPSGASSDLPTIQTIEVPPALSVAILAALRNRDDLRSLPGIPTLEFAARKHQFLLLTLRHLESFQNLDFQDELQEIGLSISKTNNQVTTLAQKFPQLLDFQAEPLEHGEAINDDYDLVVSHSVTSGTHITGPDTKVWRDHIRNAGFRWRFLNGDKFWRIMGTPGKLPKTWRLINAALVLLEAGAKVKIEIEDVSPDSYTEGEIARLETRADAAAARAIRAKGEAGGRFNSAMTLARAMQGEPIKVDHHSAGRHRRDIERMDSNMRKGVELDRKASRLESRAASRQNRADCLRDQLALKASGEAGQIEARRLEFQMLLRKEFKKIHPVIRSCFKDAEGKGSDYWAFYTVSFFNHSIVKLRLEVRETTVGVSQYSAGLRSVVLKIDNPKETFDKLRVATKGYIEEIHRPTVMNSKEFDARFDVHDFGIFDHTDTINEPATISRSSSPKKDLLKVYAWAQENRARLEAMTYSEVTLTMFKETGVHGHSYCRMD